MSAASRGGSPEVPGTGLSVCLLARDVLRFHHRAEERPMAAAKAFLKARCAGLSGYRRRRLKLMIRHMLPRFLTATLYPTEASLGVLNPLVGIKNS